MRKLIYIMGCAHCGSTLLTTLLSRHSQIATVGELKMTAIPDINTYLCGCGEPLLECEFWKEVGRACRRQGIEMDFNHFKTHYWAGSWLTARIVGTSVRGLFLEMIRSAALTAWPQARSAHWMITERNRAMIDAICETSERPVFLDGSKDPVRLLHFARSGEFDVRGIHLLRDGRAILASHKKRNPDMNANLRDWRMKTLECERVKRLIPGHKVLTLRYEDLCTDPAKEVTKILNFAELVDESTRCLSPDSGDVKHIIGHNSRLGKHQEIKLRQDWKQILTEEDLAMLTPADIHLNQGYGYA
jgi:hypothetical protein